MQSPQPSGFAIYRQYLVRLALLGLVAAGVVATVNYFADPVGAYHARFDNEPYPKPLFERQQRMAKAHTVRILEPDAILLGTSRVEIGYSPTHPAWGTDRVYNLGFPHATMDEVRAYFYHAASTKNLKTVVLALDFFQFNPILEPRPDFKDCRLLQPDSSLSHWLSPLCDVPYTLLSRQVLRQSIGMFTGTDEAPHYAHNGFRLNNAQISALQYYETQRDVFKHTEQNYAQMDDLYGGFYSTTEPSNHALEALKDVLTEATRRNIDLHIVFSPSHGRMWELLDAIGLWDTFNKWKRDVVLTANAHAEQTATEMYPVWDFAYYHEYAQEALPEEQLPEGRMRWYWDSSHFTSDLGDLVLSEVLSDERPGKLGRKLHPEMIDDWIVEIERGQQDYRLAKPGEHQKFNQDFEQYAAQVVADHPMT